MSIYPKKETEKIVETAQMRRMINRTLGVHSLSSLVAWVGRSRLGKTTTALWLNKLLNDEFSSDNPDAFRSVHYQAGNMERGDLQKKGIRSLYDACISPIGNKVYRNNTSENLARMLVEGLMIRNIKMVFIDEAGNLPLEAIRGMVLVRDTAVAMGWTLSLVFIGMDDLPIKLLRLPQINYRINDWCHFEPYSVEEILHLVSELEPYFSNYSLNDPKQREQIEFIHEQFDGAPGLIVPFLRRLKNRLHNELGGVIDIEALISIHWSFLRDKDAAISDSKGGYTGKVEEKKLEELLAK